MSNFYAHRKRNIVKTVLLMIFFFAVTISVGYFISGLVNGIDTILIAFVLSSVFVASSYWFSDSAVLLMTNAEEVDREDAPELHKLVENLSITAGLPKPKVYLIDEAAPNAFATGRSKKKAAIAVTAGLLQILDKKELEGVVAHELSHIGNNDMLLGSVAVILLGFFTLISDYILRFSFFDEVKRDKGGTIPFVGLMVGLALAVLMPFVAKMIKFSISRKRELLADATAVMLTRYPEGLASALEKINKHKSKMRSANHASAHLFITNPFGSKKSLSYVNKLFSTHPPAELRIELLREMDK